MVMKLPENTLTWVVYNANMVNRAEELIVALRGYDYFDKYVNVVSIETDVNNVNPSSIYFDPNLFNLIGNGYD